mmetsp:Transcript_97705/g.173150  ORF Transcript_97705/g.173150 Transcript_97705/m.173150 type:complete len:104 (+) Transcript_97705:50-361(+)
MIAVLRPSKITSSRACIDGRRPMCVMGHIAQRVSGSIGRCGPCRAILIHHRIEKVAPDVLVKEAARGVEIALLFGNDEWRTLTRSLTGSCQTAVILFGDMLIA